MSSVNIAQDVQEAQWASGPHWYKSASLYLHGNRRLALKVCDAKACSFQCFPFFLVIFYVGGPLLTVQAKYDESLL